MGRTVINRVVYGDAILDRFAGTGVHATIKSDHAAFKVQHAVFVKASSVVAKAEEVYDTVSRKVAKLDGGRDKTVLDLADELPPAGLGKRSSPFAGFSKYPPTRLITLPYAAETRELDALFSNILARKPPAPIPALCKKGQQQNQAVKQALKELETPLALLIEARAGRDAAIPDWEKHLRRLKDSSRVAFRDTTGRFEALFSEPDAANTNVRPRRRAKTPTDGAPADGQAAPAPAKPKRAKRRGR